MTLAVTVGAGTCLWGIMEELRDPLCVQGAERELFNASCLLPVGALDLVIFESCLALCPRAGSLWARKEAQKGGLVADLGKQKDPTVHRWAFCLVRGAQRSPQKASGWPWATQESRWERGTSGRRRDCCSLKGKKVWPGWVSSLSLTASSEVRSFFTCKYPKSAQVTCKGQEL